MAKKEIFYQGLDLLPVIIEDKSLSSPDYFRIVDLPTQLKAGINTFKFKGNPNVLIDDEEILVEILDANGEPVDYIVDIDTESAERPAVIAININQDTTPGNGKIILCSTIKQSIDGIILDNSKINLRWQVPIYIDISKRNDVEIIFNEAPIVTVSSNYDQVSEFEYRDLTYNSLDNTARSKKQIQSVKMQYGLGNTATYHYNNNTPVIVLNAAAGPYILNAPFRGFVTSSINAVINMSSSYIADLSPSTSSIKIIKQQVSSSVNLFTGSAIFAQSYAMSQTGSYIAHLKDPISYAINNSNDRYYPKTAVFTDIDITYTLSKKVDNIITFENKTQNTYNSVNINFTNLIPLIGTVAKIRLYYKSSGLDEYLLFNETDITQYDTEFGFNTGSLSTTFTVPTIHKNEKIDFKFEYISPTGFIAKQYTEIKDIAFIGGNTYVAGEDNLITGSLFVGNETGSGVQISGKNNASMIRSIGYEGFAKAKAGTSPGGFVIYSGSIQPLLNSSEVYSGVGIELYANTSSYFKYTTSGSGLLDVRTDSFFLGSKNQFISGANGNIEISSSNFHLSPNGSVNMSGDINANTGIFKDVNIIGTIATGNPAHTSPVTKYLLEAWVTSSSDLATYAANGLVKKSLTFVTASSEWSAPYYTFTMGTYIWSGSCIGYNYNFETGVKDAFYALAFTASCNAVTGALYNTNNGFDSSVSISSSGTPTTFRNWGSIVGYNTSEYNVNSNGTLITSSIDSIIFNTFNPSLLDPTYYQPYTLSITSEFISLDDINIDNPIPLQLQLQAKFINNENNWLYSRFGPTNEKGPMMYDCKFTVELYNSNNILLISDTQLQQTETSWIDFNIPLTAILLKNKTSLPSTIKIKLSWQIVERATIPGHLIGTRPKQVRITEARIIHLPISIGLSASSIKFADSYLSSTNNGTSVQGNLIPVDDQLYDLGSAAQNPLIAKDGYQFTSGVAQKRWNNIYGKFLSADSALSVGSGIVLQTTSSVAIGNNTIAAGIYSNAEGDKTSTGLSINVNGGSDTAYYYFPALSVGQYYSDILLNYNERSHDVDLNIDNIQTLGYGPTYLSTLGSLDGTRDIVRCTAILMVSAPDPADFNRIKYTAKYTLKYKDTNGVYQPYNVDILRMVQLNSINGRGAHSEGYNTQAAGKWSHTEGWNTQAFGIGAHSEGYDTYAAKDASHSEGQSTMASGSWSHAEGLGAKTIGDASHAEGYYAIASGSYSHAEGEWTTATGESSHTEGTNTTAKGKYSHAEGSNAKAIGNYSHAEGYLTQANGLGSHTEGRITIASGSHSHAEGQNSEALGYSSHAEGSYTATGTRNAYLAEDITSGVITLSGSYGNVTSLFSVDNYILANDVKFDDQIGERLYKIQSSTYSAPNTLLTITNSTNTGYCHIINVSIDKSSWLGDQYFASGTGTGTSAHTEGNNTIALGNYSHAEGINTKAVVEGSHTEGNNTMALGNYSHAEGSGSITFGIGSHTEGLGTVASGSYQHVQGQYNLSSSIQSAFIHGNGTSNVARSNLIFAAGTQVQITGSLKTTTDLLVNGIDVGRGGSIFSVLMGVDALANNTSGQSNVAIGYQAAFTSTNASGLTAIGRRALYANTAGSANTAVGAFTLQANSTGNNNTAVGREAMTSSSLGYQNTAVGRSAMFANTSGNNNSAFGHESLLSNTLGDGNVAVGDDALSLNILGNGNVAIGFGANTLASGNSNSIVIGSGSKGLGANTTVLGNTSTTLTALQGQIAIGTTSVNTSAQVQIDSTTRGVLLPRMTTTQINAIVSPLKGLTVFNTTLNTLCTHNGTAWRQVVTTAM